MRQAVISLPPGYFIRINAPLIGLNLAVNIYYACCLVVDSQRLKRPVKLLLGSLVQSAISYSLSLALLCFALHHSSYGMFIVAWVMVQFYTHNSLTSYVWLNFYYYTQIVPARRAFSVWLKRNVVRVIAGAVLLDWALLLFNSGIYLTFELLLLQDNKTLMVNYVDGLYYSYNVCFTINCLQCFICLTMTAATTLSTGCYLQRHFRSLARSRGSFSSQRLHMQLRVTMSGLWVGAMCFLYNLMYLVDVVVFKLSETFYMDKELLMTITSLYISGTSVSLAISQSAFRRGADDVWKACAGCYGNK